VYMFIICIQLARVASLYRVLGGQGRCVFGCRSRCTCRSALRRGLSCFHTQLIVVCPKRQEENLQALFFTNAHSSAAHVHIYVNFGLKEKGAEEEVFWP
jgi:hypothetical protein